MHELGHSSKAFTIKDFWYEIIDMFNKEKRILLNQFIKEYPHTAKIQDQPIQMKDGNMIIDWNLLVIKSMKYILLFLIIIIVLWFVKRLFV